MPEIGGQTLRAWRRSRGWDVPEVARQLRRAAGHEPLPVHDALVRMIYRWERVGLRTERYELLYRRLGLDEAEAVLAGEVTVSDYGPEGADTTAEARDVMALARDYGTAALLFAQEAEGDEAIAWSVKSKTARWQKRFVESAELARRGLEVGGPTSTRVELAYREAIAIALFGDLSRARSALQRAERTAETLACDGSSISVWSFPAVRQAIFSLSVAVYTGDPAAALRGAAAADACWSAGESKVPATWAQVRAGAGMAYLMMGSLDGAAAEITPMLELAPELRIDTVTSYLANVDRMLSQRRFADSRVATGLRQQIREFSSASVS